MPSQWHGMCMRHGPLGVGVGVGVLAFTGKYGNPRGRLRFVCVVHIHEEKGTRILAWLKKKLTPANHTAVSNAVSIANLLFWSVRRATWDWTKE